MKRDDGFTLIELLIVLALVAILATIGGPAFWSFIQNIRTTALANEFVTAANVARSEASKRGLRVELCASDNQTGCSDDPSHWTENWIVQEEDSGTVIRVWNDLPGGLELNEAGSEDSVVFNARGETAAAATYDFELWFDGCTGDQTRDIDINAAGRAGVTRNDGQCN